METLITACKVNILEQIDIQLVRIEYIDERHVFQIW